MSLVLKADVVLTMDNEYRVLQPGFVRIDKDTITEVGEGAPKLGPEDDLEDLGHSLLMPGLINSHTHTPMILTRGMCEGVSLFTMDGFLNKLRLFESYLDADLSALTMEATMGELIRTGTTTFADQYFYADKIFNVTKKAGLRGIIAYGIVELGDEETRKREVRYCEEFLDMCAEDPVVKGWVGPHAFFVDNSLDLINTEIALAKKYDVGFHFHFATSNEENDWCAEHYGCTAVEKMRDLGILEVPMLAAHAITVSEEDMDILKDYPYTAVMSPSSSMKSGFPAAPMKAYREHGINTALGTDNVCASNSYDLFREMATAAKLIINREGDVKAVDCREMVAMVTRNGAKALHRDDLGSLEKGKKADIIALDLYDIGWAPICAQDYYTQLVYSISGMTVTHTMVNGKFLMKDRKLLTVDYRAAVAQLEEANKELRRRMAADGK